MEIITMRDFRNEQTKYLKKAREGEEIILKSRSEGAFKIIPISEDETLISKGVFLKKMKNMSDKRLKREIKSWFEDNRPDMEFRNEITDEFITDIYEPIKDELADLSRPARLIVLNEFLNETFSSVEFRILEDLVSDEDRPYKELFDSYKEMGICYYPEMGMLTDETQRTKILEKFRKDNQEDEDLFYDDDIRNAIAKILDDYMERQRKADEEFEKEKLKK